MKSSQNCPICAADVAPSSRYPRYVCVTCAARATDAGGRQIAFSNSSLSGGYQAHYTDTDASYPHHDCYIDGRHCWADEARFGGIVIQVDEPNDSSPTPTDSERL